MKQGVIFFPCLLAILLGDQRENLTVEQMSFEATAQAAIWATGFGGTAGALYSIYNNGLTNLFGADGDARRDLINKAAIGALLMASVVFGLGMVRGVLEVPSSGKMPAISSDVMSVMSRLE